MVVAVRQTVTGAGGRAVTTAVSWQTPVAGMRDEPAHDLRAFLDRAEPTGASAMAGDHIGLEQEVMRIGTLGAGAVVAFNGDDQRIVEDRNGRYWRDHRSALAASLIISQRARPVVPLTWINPHLAPSA